jgi:hypothetical protein
LWIIIVRLIGSLSLFYISIFPFGDFWAVLPFSACMDEIADSCKVTLVQWMEKSAAGMLLSRFFMSAELFLVAADAC